MLYDRNCEQRLKACDDAFREQLEAKEKLYHSNLARLLAEKNGELEAAHQKVSFHMGSGQNFEVVILGLRS